MGDLREFAKGVALALLLGAALIIVVSVIVVPSTPQLMLNTVTKYLK
jgi:hypothetical protein